MATKITNKKPSCRQGRSTVGQQIWMRGQFSTPVWREGSAMVLSDRALISSHIAAIVTMPLTENAGTCNDGSNSCMARNQCSIGPGNGGQSDQVRQSRCLDPALAPTINALDCYVANANTSVKNYNKKPSCRLGGPIVPSISKGQLPTYGCGKNAIFYTDCSPTHIIWWRYYIECYNQRYSKIS